MYVYKEQIAWDEMVEAFKTHLGENPGAVKDSAKENIYITDPAEKMCFDYHRVVRGLYNAVKALKKENEELKEKVQNMNGWLASKELQGVLVAKVEHLEKLLKVDGDGTT